MPDIKIKPQMDQPKIRVVNNAPKDAGSILKKEYAARQKEKQPDTKGPVQYATDRVETTGRRGTVAAADGVRRMTKKAKSSRKGGATTTRWDTRQKARNLAEKESIIAPRTSGAITEGRQIVKHYSAAPKHDTPVPLKQTAAQRARQMVQRKTQKKMLTQTATKAKQGIKTGAQALAQGVMVIGRAAATAISSVLATGGGLALFLVLLVVIVIGAIAASPFGILFSDENTTSDTVPVAAAIALVRDDFNDQLEALQTADAYDHIALVGSAPDWMEILAVFAVKVASSNTLDAADVVTIDADRISRLKTVFWDMCEISYEIEIIEHADSDPDDGVDDSWTEKNLTITIVPETATDMKTTYRFIRHQIVALDELLLRRDILLELVESLSSVDAVTSKLLKALPEDLPEDREAVIRVACSLVGKVNYFWGGKSHVVGWDSRWGQLYKVTVSGSPTTGSYRPYGMDCSGYVDWVFNNALGYLVGHGGGAMMQHTYCTDITWDEAQIGDLAFYPDDEHVGIVAGWDENGDILIIHCASGYNNVVITGKEGFVSVARPNIFTEEA